MTNRESLKAQIKKIHWTIQKLSFPKPPTGWRDPDLLSYFTDEYLYTGFRFHLAPDEVDLTGTLYVLAAGANAWNYRILPLR